MIRKWICLVVLVGSAFAQKATLLPGVGRVHHAVSTSNPQAQKFFDPREAGSRQFAHRPVQVAHRGHQGVRQAEPSRQEVRNGGAHQGKVFPRIADWCPGHSIVLVTL